MLLKSLCVLLILTVPYNSTTAQSKPAAAFQVKAAYLYNFTRFVEWRPEEFAAPDEPFVIGILGDRQTAEYLKEIVRGETVENHPIVVQQYGTVGEVRNCQILFLGSGEAFRARESIAELNRKGILTVSDADNFLRWGGMIRFFSRDNKIRIQINTGAARAGQLQISSKLLSIASDY